ncbi:hypothetical protein DOY81_006705 [Sarcophaga bullata]|nr:hypothetical protein DOY81_006705 [Sarcophaga bullata]
MCVKKNKNHNVRRRLTDTANSIAQVKPLLCRKLRANKTTTTTKVTK